MLDSPCVWAKTWFIVPTSMHQGHAHPYSQIRRTECCFHIPEDFELALQNISRESLIARFKSSVTEEARTGTVDRALIDAALRVPLDNEAPAGRRNININTIRLMYGDSLSLLDPLHSVTTDLSYAFVRCYVVMGKIYMPIATLMKTLTGWIPTKPFDLPILSPYAYSVAVHLTLMWSVATFTQEVLTGAMRKLHDAEGEEARKLRCTTILDYFHERGRLMRQLYHEL